MYIVCIKDDIAISTAVCFDLAEAQAQFATYDEIKEISYEDFCNMPLPSKFVGDKWVETSDYPVITYPQKEDKQETPKEETTTVYDELAAAYKEGVQEA